MEKTITSEMLSWTCDFTVTSEGFSVKDDFGRVEVSKPKWNCKGVSLSALILEGAFGGNSLRVKLANNVIRKFKRQNAATKFAEVIQTEGVDVAKLIAGKSVLPIEVQAADMSAEEIDKTIKALQALKDAKEGK